MYTNKQKKKQIKPFGNLILPKEFYHLLKDAGKQGQIITQAVFEVTEKTNNWRILAKSHSIQNGDNDLIPLKEKQTICPYRIRNSEIYRPTPKPVINLKN